MQSPAFFYLHGNRNVMVVKKVRCFLLILQRIDLLTQYKL
jgi:hypothetical protein